MEARSPGPIQGSSQVTMCLSHPGCPPTLTPSFQLCLLYRFRNHSDGAFSSASPKHSLLESPNCDIMLITAVLTVPGPVLSILLMLTYVKECAGSYVAVGVEPGREPR